MLSVPVFINRQLSINNKKGVLKHPFFYLLVYSFTNLIYLIQFSIEQHF
jgi:hypothetical protein